MGHQFQPDANDIINRGNNNNYQGKPITEIITNGFFTVDHKWTVKYWNKAAERIMGVQSKDIVGSNLWEKFADILPVNFYAVYHKAFLQDVPVHFEEYWEEMDAWFNVVTFYCDNTLSVSFKSSRRPAHVNYSTLPEYQAQQLKSMNQLYRLVAEVTNDCLWEWDLRAKEIFWIDGGHKRVFGYSIENALIPQSYWESRLHPEDKAGLLTRLNKVITDGSVMVWEDEYRFKKANGDYAFVHDRGQIIYDGNGKASRMVGATQDITSKILLENKLVQERQTNQREITDAVLTALENERATIGRELHDNLGQVLAVAKMYVQMAQKSEMKRELYLEKSCDCIVNVMQEIRKISKALVIPGTHIIGLFDNIENLLHDFGIMHSIKIDFSNDDIDEKSLDEKLQLTLFRIVQEQVNNILKHAKATHATINLSRHENNIVLLISDNGVGCDVLKEKNGVGIINIRSRAELYNGRVIVVSKPGEGYQLKVVLPVKD